MADITITLKLRKSGWCVLRKEEATKDIFTLRKGTKMQSEYGWVVLWIRKVAFVKQTANFTSANCSMKILLAECLLLYLQIDFICTTCAYCCWIVISSFYEVISHILIVLTEGALVVNMVTPWRNNMLCPFLILEICNILCFKIHKVSA